MALPRNPKRSGGPRTKAGLAAVSLNAIKTGAYAATAVLPHEDAAEYDTLEKQMFVDFEPVGAVEFAMVRDLAMLVWKRMRVNRVEQAVLHQMILLPLTEERVQRSFGPGFVSRAMSRLEPYVPPSGAEYARALEVRQQLFCTLEEAKEPPAPELEHVLNEALTTIWLQENRTEIEAALRRAKDTRLLEYMKRENTQRAYDDVGRAFYRTLAELRKQQDWRIRRSAVLVTDARVKEDVVQDVS